MAGSTPVIAGARRPGLPRRLVRAVFTFLHGLRRSLWAASGGPSAGVHAVPLTQAGRVVLVLLTYAPGWRLPGGGLKRGEAPRDAMLRELREEIGLVSHGPIERLEDLGADADQGGGASSIFVVRDVVYRPRRSLEVEAVREFDPLALPDDTARWTVGILARRFDLRLPAAPPGGG